MMEQIIQEALTLPLEFIWLFMALLFFGTEILTPGLFYCLAFALGSLSAAATAYLDYSIATQCIALLSTTVIAFFLLNEFIKKQHLSKKQFEKNSTNIDALIGQQAVVIEPIEPNKRGLVKIRGELWPAKTNEDKTLLKDSLVTVIHLTGNCVLVK